MLTKVISGGQTGADQAALRAARKAGIPTGGWAPPGYRTEAGLETWLRDYGLAEHPSRGYPARTRENVKDADATLVFCAVDSAGTNLTDSECARQGKPFRGILLDVVGPGEVRVSRVAIPPNQIADWLAENHVRVLNVAGNRESKAPGIGLCAEAFLLTLFRLLKKEKTP